MGTQLIWGLWVLVFIGQPTPPAPILAQVPKTTDISTPIVPSSQAQKLVQIIAPLRCDARPYQRLVGRTVADLLTAKLPPNTRVYRLDDPVSAANPAGRLSVELNRSTRVRRVYCS